MEPIKIEPNLYDLVYGDNKPYIPYGIDIQQIRRDFLEKKGHIDEIQNKIFGDRPVNQENERANAKYLERLWHPQIKKKLKSMERLTITELIILIKASKKNVRKFDRGSKKYNAWMNIYIEAERTLLDIEEKLKDYGST